MTPPLRRLRAPIPPDFRLALLEDTYEVVAGLEFVTPVLALTTPDPDAEAVTWPGTPIVHTTGLVPLLAALGDLGADQAVVVAGDAPDLPPLLIGKLFRALGGGEVAICPARDGGLVALAAHLPAPDWLTGVDLDTSDAPEPPARRGRKPRSRTLRAGLAPSAHARRPLAPRHGP